MAYINTMGNIGIEQIHGLATFPLNGKVPAFDVWQVKHASRGPGFFAEMPSPVFCALWYIVGGAAEVESVGKVFELSPGDAMLCPPGIARTIRVTSDEPLEQIIVLAHRSRVLHRLQNTFRVLPLQIPAAGNADIRESIERLRAEALVGGEHAMHISDALFELTLQYLSRARSQRPSRQRGHERFERCRQIIDDGCERLRTLRDLAAACGMHAGSLCRLFKSNGARSPYQELLRAKMTRAAELLLTTDMTVKAVGAQVGYEDPYDFSRAFKRMMHVSPRPYRERRGRE